VLSTHGVNSPFIHVQRTPSNDIADHPD